MEQTDIVCPYIAEQQHAKIYFQTKLLKNRKIYMFCDKFYETAQL